MNTHTIILLTYLFTNMVIVFSPVGHFDLGVCVFYWVCVFYFWPEVFIVVLTSKQYINAQNNLNDYVSTKVHTLLKYNVVPLSIFTNIHIFIGSLALMCFVSWFFSECHIEQMPIVSLRFSDCHTQKNLLYSLTFQITIPADTYCIVWFFRLPYAQIFGGVSAISTEQFRNINGFSNIFFGWGGEDDDMYRR
jgi:hypothetical protein